MLIQDHFTEPRTERRREVRQAVTRPCKVLHGPTGRYIAAETRDVSAMGTLLTVDSPREIMPGDRVDVLIAWDDRGLLREEEARRGTVVRVMRGQGQRQYVGVSLASALEGRATGRMAA